MTKRPTTICLSLILGVAACSGEGTTDPPTPVPTEVSVSPEAVVINVIGGSVQLTARVLDQDGRVLSQPVSWSSSSEAVASVTQSGLVTATGDGTASVMASSGGLSGSATVTVATTAPTITQVAPAQIVEGEPATLTGTGFARIPGGNLVRVGGENADVVSVSSTSITFEVPMLCGPSVRDVEVTVTSSELESDPVTHPVAPGPALQVAEGQQTVIPGGGTVCLQFPESDGPTDYLVGVQSLNPSPSVLTPVRVSSTIDAGAVAVPPLASASNRRGPVATGPRLEEDPRTRLVLGHRAQEAEYLSGEVELISRLAREWRSHPATARGPAPVPDLEVGQQVSLKVRDFNGPQSCNQAAEVTATVRARTAHSIFLTDDANPGGGFTQSEVQALAENFEQKIYAPHVAMFGDPSDRDRNGRIAVVITQEVNKTNGDDGRIQGFVSGCDFFPKAVAPDSNEGEVFYVVAPDPTGIHGQEVPKTLVSDIFPFVIAHELTHITQFGVRIDAGAEIPEVYHLEGQATYAEEVVGHAVEGNTSGQNYGADVAWDFDGLASTRWYVAAFADHLWYFGGRFNTDPQDTKVPGAPEQCTWLDDVDDPCISRASFYGISWSFMRWTADQFFAGNEPAFQQALIRSDLTGFALFESVIGRPMETLLPAWAAALYLDDREPVDPSLAFTSWNLLDIIEGGQVVPTGRLEPRVRAFADFSDDVQVRSGSTAYWRISGASRPPTAVKVRRQDGAGLPGSLVVWVVNIPG